MGRKRFVPRQPELLGSILTQRLEDLGLAKQVKTHQAVVLWPKIVGEKIAAEAQAVRIEEGRLVVKVPKPVWRQELINLKPRLIAKINATIGQAVVSDIFFTG